MSVAQDSSTKRVYVRLLNEGTNVYRPAEAIVVGESAVRLVAPADYDPEDEEWEFKPGEIMRLEGRTLDGREALVAVSLAGAS